PLVYIDGVRVNNRMESGGRDVSRIDDLDPAMIESMEVIKGPAAATLYGTEAANGVINIRTKAGAVGTAQWNFTMRQGAQWFRDPAGHTPTNWGVNPLTNNIESLNILESQAESDLMFRNGHTQYYAADVSGGTDAFQYFVSGSIDDSEGVTLNSWAKKYNGRINVRAQPNDELTLSANTGISLTRLRLPSDYPYEEAVYADPTSLDDARRGYKRATPESRIEKDYDRHNANRFTGGLTATHTPFDWFTHRLTFGLDVTDQEESFLDRFLSAESAQFYSTNTALGGKSINREAVLYTTFDYAATGTRQLTERLSSSTSAGFQVYTKRIENVFAEGDRFPALGLSSVSAAGLRSGSDNLIENNTVGVYLQQQFGWQDRLFITAAIRADDNSSFGEDFDLVYYPKVSGSWVVSEEDFWGLDFINSFRLRAAYGESGQQPDAFDALRSFTTRASPSGQATVTPDSPGNSELGPERGVEIEAGFDASLFDGRLSVDFTYYDQTTKDAIVGRNVPPSTGFTDQKFVNIGEINNRGIELGLNARVLETDPLDWDLNVTASTNRNRVVDLGLDGFLQLGWTTRHAEGFPVG
ncbi:MAG: TonB-dependent receptor, partial [Halobacteriales archaeon]|nr:TonB-dependent receptor [Halobacteriales archaeon]